MLTNLTCHMSNGETFGPLLHGTARAWRLKLDERLKPMGLSQAKWRTLLHLSIAPGTLTQTEIAERLGIEEPSLVTLLHRLENEGWITRKSSPRDRRCKMVLLGQRAQNVISQISAEAEKLRHELLENISAADLRTCVRVLTQICEKTERKNGNGALTKIRSTVTATVKNEHRARGRTSRRG